MPECHHLVDLRACASCADPAPTRREPSRASRVFTAMHDSTCAACDFDIRRGQPVRFDTDDRLKHASCAQDTA